jgi:hypothetical protein
MRILLRIARVTCPVLFSLAAAIPASNAEKPNLSGSWRLNPAKSSSHEPKMADVTWVIDQKDETAIHISQISKQADGKQVKTDLDCTIDGKECSTSQKEPSKISFWYNGPMLVQMEYRGPHREVIVKRRMKLSSDGNLMSVELIPILGTAPAGNLVFEKQ